MISAVAQIVMKEVHKCYSASGILLNALLLFCNISVIRHIFTLKLNFGVCICFEETQCSDGKEIIGLCGMCDIVIPLKHMFIR